MQEARIASGAVPFPVLLVAESRSNAQGCGRRRGKLGTVVASRTSEIIQRAVTPTLTISPLSDIKCIETRTT